MSGALQALINTVNSGTPAEVMNAWDQAGELSIENFQTFIKEAGTTLVAFVQSPEGQAYLKEKSRKLDEQSLKKQIDTYGRALTEKECIVSRMIPDMEAWNLGWCNLVKMDRKKQKKAASIESHNRILKSIWETANLLRITQSGQMYEG